MCNPCRLCAIATLAGVYVQSPYVRMILPVNYGEEDIPNDFPLREGNAWEAEVDIDTGEITDWPVGKSGNLEMKVCDEGVYVLLDYGFEEIASLKGYVPAIVPRDGGDYVNLKINSEGIITNWPKGKKASVADFFSED